MLLLPHKINIVHTTACPMLKKIIVSHMMLVIVGGPRGAKVPHLPGKALIPARVVTSGSYELKE